MLHRHSHLFTALGCLQTLRVLCQSSGLADTWSESCAVMLARWCPQTDSVCPLLPPLMSEMGEATHNQPPVQLWAPPAWQDSPLAMAWAQLCVPGNGWGKDKMVPAEDAIRQGWGCCVGKELQSAGMGVLLSEPTPFVEVEQQTLLLLSDVRSSLCSWLSFPEGSVLILASCRILLGSAWIPPRWGPGEWGSCPISCTAYTVPCPIYQAGGDWCRCQLWDIICWR